jgi:diguanylate cyclase (GGDEF)-like protein
MRFIPVFPASVGIGIPFPGKHGILKTHLTAPEIGCTLFAYYIFPGSRDKIRGFFFFHDGNQGRSMILRLTKSITVAVKAAAYGFYKSLLDGETIDSILGYIDDLTRLPNRRAFNRDIASFEKFYSLIMVDIDDFKAINDRKGHLFGDLVLRRIAELLRKSVGPSGTIYRFGGDEFLIVLPSVEVATVCGNIRSSFNDEDSFSVSLGVVASFQPSMLHDFLDLTDKAMYPVKTEGKEKIAFLSIANPPAAERKRPRFYLRFRSAGAAHGASVSKQAPSTTD